MDARAGMPARLSERSMGPGDGWKASDVWFEECEGTQDELHARVAHRKDQAAEFPACHRKRGACDTRERAWRHLNICPAAPRRDRTALLRTSQTNWE